MKHIKAFTYAPKIPAVLDGRCRQTIRPEGKRPVAVGDTILFHGWQDRPYRSPWSWRKEVEVINVIPARVLSAGMLFNGASWHWDELDWLAERDGIDPPTGIELGRLFNSMYSLNPVNWKHFQIIRW